ncbi:secreted phosphoprotein 24 [Rhinolophus sinicus]|uniref:secreted phosphoprotein 24 n=1 Tax=Rhinolophus sinicus TaxID=89399 RepID=UPI003D7C1134
MEKMVLKILLMCALGLNHWMCTGFPVYSYNQSFMTEALSVSVAKVNAQSSSPYLFRAFRSSVKSVDLLDEERMSIDMQFSIQETTCRRDSGEDPATCDFQTGYYVPAAVCRSTVWMSAGEVEDASVHCRWSASSESSSSEEILKMIFANILRSSTGRNNYQLGLTPDKPRSEQFHEQPLETRTRIFAPERRRYPMPWHRARITTGFE